MRSSTSTRLRAAGALAVAAATTFPLVGCMPNHEPPARNIADTVVAPAPGAMGVQPGVESVPEVTRAPEESPSSEARPPSTPATPPSPATGEALEIIGQALPELTGIAIAPVGRAEEVTVLGDVQTGVAWSTSKVPLAIAALRANPGATTQVRAAITQSDNEAAEALWEGLGGGESAASAVTDVLRQARDEKTTIPATRLREGFTVFGQTQWDAANQARFAAHLPCLPDSAAVLGEMGSIVPEQRWGLGRIDGASFKGGWGPADTHAGYLARQFGILPTPSGDVAVAVLADAPDLGAAEKKLDAIAQTLTEQLGDLPGGVCAPSA